ncbi:post-segregation antitoxin CcdA [Litorivita pollutaquae]|uniref:Post-segregation antitoxin CcdA n=1 Tax=Litorivita pollutaquae TaxID=2200892 RepID=A0A2V4NQF4_9RHOB|nr:type II toxin-antitoxin system CcdA family antitoxin [Litorivita pollutaquae]PYC46906.1 post-segregation antitoxin CcdA [Litorivita pollutaquae]
MSRIEGRKPTNLSLDAALVSRARESQVNLSRAAEEGIRAALRARSREDWRKDNAEALESSNSFAAQSGLPLAGFRRF